MSLTYVQREREYTVKMRAKGRPVHDKPAFVASQMRDVCLAPFEAFESLGQLAHSKNPHRPGRHIYIDRGSPVLGVAHLDSVNSNNYFWVNGEVVQCPTIDNRLGAWILLHGLPSMGIYPDVLLTENEEHGQSTGADFKPDDKRWGWMFMFDRKDDDAVFYQYGKGALEKAVKAAGFTIGVGSYSCIRSMDHLGIEGVNIGCGMKDYHSRRAHAYLDTIEAQLVRFASLYKQIEQDKFVYTPPTYTYVAPSLLHQPRYQDESWFADEGMWLPQPKRKAKVKKGLIVRKAERLADRLIEDAYELEVIMNLGLATFLDSEVYVGDWQEVHCIPPEAKVDANKVFACPECDLDYHEDDGKFLHYQNMVVCRGCWLEIVDRLGLMPTYAERLEDEAKRKPKKKPEPLLPLVPIQPTEGDSNANYPSPDRSPQEDARPDGGQGGDHPHQDGQELQL